MVVYGSKGGANDRWRGRRGLSTAAAAVVLLVVILVVGGLGYIGFNAVKSSPVSRTSCSPSASPVCAQFSNQHDVVLTAPFKAVQQGNVIPFTAALPPGESSSAYAFNFGDGSTVATSTTPSHPHVYSSPGTYLASVTATVNGLPHDNDRSLVLINVAPSYASGSAGESPSVAGHIVANTTATTGPTAILQPGGTVTLSGSYTSAPTNPSFIVAKPTLAISPSGGTLGTILQSNSSASAQATFPNPGVFWVKFVGSAVGPSGTAYQNYTWTVFVSPTGVHAGVQGGQTAVSPHKGALDVYEFHPGGSQSEDPAIDYESVGFEVLLNVYQTLIAYNGSQTGPTYDSYVPQIATCVPGSPTCQALYGTSLISGNHYTFVVGGDSQFYDPATQKGWGVWPTDVLFSVARTMGFAVQPCIGCNNGWILAQSLLSPGNSAWDGGIHGPLNNTPSNVLGSVTLNDSTYCPMAKLSPTDHGCVTFNASAGGHGWPYFLELISDAEGAAIVPCAWFSAAPQSAGIPGWTSGPGAGLSSTDKGDHPCGAPGISGYGSANLPAKAWDAWETAGAIPPFVGNVQWSMAGTGPYYLKAISPGSSYTLQANPVYQPNSRCSWTGCSPQKGQFAATVSVTWTTTQVPGEQAYAAGSADLAGIPVTDTALLLQLIQQGKVGATSFPSISIYFFPFDFAFNLQATQKFTSNPVTIPSDFFSYVGMRQFFSHAYPYGTIQQTIDTKDGIQYYFGYGGAIPQFMANYYPRNISWPSGDPCPTSTDPNCPAFWWNQMSMPSSPYYDPEVASCTTSNPCQMPLFGETGSPDLDQRLALWASEINSLSGGRVQVTPVDLNFVQLVINSVFSAPYTNPMPLFTLAWAPDYPDPTDYMVPMYMKDGSYTFGNAVWEQANLPQFNASTCKPYVDFTWYSSNPVANNCQGAAFSAMQYAMQIAAVAPAGPLRVLLYNEIESIANSLALYTYQGQANTVTSYAAWIDGSTINSNVTIGGGNVFVFYSIGGNGVY